MSGQPKFDLQLMTRPELLATLRDLLVEEFNDPAYFRLAMQEAGITTTKITFDASATVLWNNIVSEAGKQGKLSALIEIIGAEYTNHIDQLRQLVAAIDARERETTQTKSTTEAPSPSISPTNNFAYDVFISYSSPDQPIARALAQRLRNDGLSVWFDEWVIKPGDKISLRLEEGLRQSRILILFMSENVSASDWMSLEQQIALFSEQTNQQRSFIPLRLDNCPLPETMAQYSYLNWRMQTNENYAKLYQICQPFVANSSNPLYKELPLVSFRSMDTGETVLEDIDRQKSDKLGQNLLRRHTNVTFPHQCALDIPQQLTIQLTAAPNQRQSNRDSVAIGLHPNISEQQKQVVTLIVTVSAKGFLVDPSWQTLFVPFGSDTEPLTFILTGKKLGEQLIEIRFFHRANRVGYIAIKTEVL